MSHRRSFFPTIALQLEFHELEGVLQPRQDLFVLLLFSPLDLGLPEFELFLHSFLEKIHGLYAAKVSTARILAHTESGGIDFARLLLDP